MLRGCFYVVESVFLMLLIRISEGVVSDHVKSCLALP